MSLLTVQVELLVVDDELWVDDILCRHGVKGNLRPPPDRRGPYTY